MKNLKWIALFLIIGSAAIRAQEIRITGNSVEIECGDTTPSTADYTSFGTVHVDGSTVTRKYYISNDSGGDLNLSGSPRVAIIGSHASDFTVISQPPSPISNGRTGYFEIRFDPSMNGDRSATVSITNNDADENPYTYAIEGTGMGGSFPEMDVWGNGVEISDEDSSPSSDDWTDFGYADYRDDTVTREFTIKNTGTADLALDGTPRVVTSGDHSSDFTVNVQPASSVGQSSQTTFEVTFDPSAEGARNAEIQIDSNDPDEDPYNFAITGTGSAPDIGVSGNNQSISNGDTTPTESDHTHFGSVQEAGSTTKTYTYTIDNSSTGGIDLVLNGSPLVELSGDNAADFEVTTLPDETVEANRATTFRITFNPSDFGTRSATVSIPSNDPDENPYTFAVEGIGVAPSAPEINISGDDQDIVDGDTTPSVNDDTDFGSVAEGSSKAHVYTVTNQGTASLSLNGSPSVAISGSHTGDFSVTSNPESTVASDYGTTTFEITFTPQSSGLRTATVSISNDDSDESSYTFAVQGTGLGPEMDVTGNGNAVSCGSSSPSESNYTDFGSVQMSSSQARTFNIENNGNTALSLSGTPRVEISGSHAGDFSVTIEPSSSVDSGSSTSLQVTFSPGDSDVRTATVSIDNNDSDEDPYTFAIQGTGEASLPVELHSLSAACENGEVTVAWVTESETDNLGFFLDRAVRGDGYAPAQWNCIASYEMHDVLLGQGNSSERHEYAFVDADVAAGHSYIYRLSDMNTVGEVHVYDQITIALPEAPKETVLEPPFPNPFNPQTKIAYQLAETGPVEIVVYDLLGRKIRTLVSEDQSAGSYNIYWHGDDTAGRKTATGTYLIVLKTVDGMKTQKAVMVR
ncbi:choice-of-anchor D domain-containing protein [bacterium]|nr:choice-of-anchor D domain-containing protein [bacterium]